MVDKCRLSTDGDEVEFARLVVVRWRSTLPDFDLIDIHKLAINKKDDGFDAKKRK